MKLSLIARFIPQAVGVAVILVGPLVLAGWMLDSVLLKSVFPGLPTMKPDTAVALLLAGLSLWLWLWVAPARGPGRRRSAQACAVATVLMGVSALIASLWGWDLGLGHVLVHGRMAPATALTFLLIGCALLLLDVETRRGYRPARFLALPATVVPLSALLVYAYGAQSDQFVAPYGSMALHTAATLALLCAGVLFARPGGLGKGSGVVCAQRPEGPSDKRLPTPSLGAGEAVPGEARARLYAWLPTGIVALAVLALVIGNAALRYVEARLVASAGEALALAAADIANKLDLLLAERYGDMQIMTQTPAFQDRNVAAMTRHLTTLQEAYPVYAWLGVTDAQGRIIAATDPSSVGKNQSAQHWFLAARAPGGVSVTEAEPFEESGGPPAVVFAAPITSPGGEFLGAVTARVGLRAAEDVIAWTARALQTLRGPSAKIEWQFMTRDGDVLVDSILRQEGRVNLKRLALPSALFVGTARPGYVEETHLRRQVPVVTGYAQTEGFGGIPGPRWGILIRMDRRDVMAPVHAVLVKLAVAGAVVVTPLLGFLLWSTRQMKTEWTQAQKEAARATAAEAALHERHTALQLLVAAVREVTAISNLEPFLQRLTETACRLTGARYGALGVFDKDGKRLTPFFTVGIDEATRKAIGDLPTGRGLLGTLASSADALRLKDLTCHPDSVGFPPHHPPMRSFLGMSIRSHGRLFGRLYLTDKLGPGGEVIEFTELDEKLIAALAAQAGVAVENVQLLLDTQRTAEALRTSNRELESFVYAISHDLQTPLRAIHGFADLLVKRVKDKLDERERHFVARIQAGTQRMAFLINDLLEYSRVERITHPFEAVSMEEVLAEARGGLQDMIGASRAVLICEDRLPVVWADRVRMVQVWMNLLANAIKFAKPGAPPHITIRYTEDEREFTFLVRDNGIGIPPDFHARIFELFRRLHAQEAYEGTGVGLALVKRIIEFHKGRVWVESVEGRGSTFFFTIPKTQNLARKETVA